ncbi:ATP-binding protein [Pseudorhodobacter sp. W20_MBD10_FR17]|uniref:PAS domain-containing hybrid sensor histidine kinase/response regulator n=1 Tax=Pseudorhodobacter sp. W20_MBD10_FR17 TaxID=3240266 RepID=UPI003F9BB532
MGLLLQSNQQNTRLNSILSAPLLVAVLGATLAVLLHIAIQFHLQLEKTRVAASDSRMWSVVQMEVDHQNLLFRVAEYQHQVSSPAYIDVSADIVAVAFDIFFSRTIITSVILGTKATPENLRLKVVELVRSRDALADTFDGLDFTDPAALLQFQAGIAALDEPIRQISLGALDHFVEQAQTARSQEAVLWSRLLTTNIALLFLMSGAMFLALRLRKQIARQFRNLQNATDNIRMVYEKATLAVIICDCNGNVLLFNPEAQKLFGRSEADMLGRSISDTIIPTRLRAAHQKGMGHYKNTGQGKLIDAGSVQTVGMRADGSEVSIELSLRASRDFLGQATHIAFIRDISEQLAHERILQNAMEEASLHAAAKSKFLATMSHEMRTPLHGLLASLELIDDEGIEPSSRELLQTARDCGLRSLEQINDVLQISRMEEVNEPLAAHVPEALVRKIFDELGSLAAPQNTQLLLNVSGATTDQLWMGKPRTFLRVMYNLIGNAIKFTHNGTVVVNLEFSSTDAENQTLHVIVQDSGIGISRENCLQIFDPFFTTCQPQGGAFNHHTGLGLPIAQKGVTELDGVLAVSSKLGQGSSFFFDIPLTLAPDTVAECTRAENEITTGDFDLKCLVVDDNIVNLSLTAQTIRKMGCNVQMASSGLDAVDLCAETAFDIIFMDINMPGGVSGTEATAMIRAAGCCSNAVVVALTADTTFKWKENLSLSKVNFVMHKPINKDVLIKMLSKVSLCSDKEADIHFDATTDEHDGTEPEFDFDELVEFIGEASALNLLSCVGKDISAASDAILDPTPNTPDILHRAIGSTAAIGLVKLSKLLRQAEDRARDGNIEDCPDLIKKINRSIANAKSCITAQ